MDWLTKEYIKAEAKKGRKQALECTRLHWWQLVKAGPEELKEEYYSSFDLGPFYCAMCERYDANCPSCILHCLRFWRIAYKAFHKWNRHPTRANWRKWKTAAKAMLAKIDRLYERLYGNKK